MNTNNRLEKELRARAAEIFAADEPPAGHRERFVGRLDAWRASRRRRRLSWRLTFGAVTLAAAVALTAVWLWPTTTATNDVRSDDATESPVEVQRYYAMRLDHELEATRTLIDNIDDEDRRDLLDELHAMQAEDVPDVQLADDEQITLIVRVYTSKIDALKRIQTQLSISHNKEES